MQPTYRPFQASHFDVCQITLGMRLVTTVLSGQNGLADNPEPVPGINSLPAKAEAIG